MITPEQTITLARATLDQGLNFSRTDHITRATDAELVKFAQEAIDAATVELRAELLASQKYDKLLAESVIEREELRQALQKSRNVLMHQNALIERIERLNPNAGEIGAGMLASLVEDARRVLSFPIPE